ncbi:hypothetical protein KY334_05430 [Candidatus Woesearchaeota archaeon]|nr:hypothetical protein [Candidatus Woesearchaeota archaeon]
MYRNVSYNVNTNDSWTGEITISTWDENGKRIQYTTTHQSYLYHADNRGQAKSWFGDPIKLKRFDSVPARYRWLKDNPNIPVFECLSPVNEFLINNFLGQNQDIEEFTKYPLRIGYFDIEVAVENEFPAPSEAKYPINLITLYDNFEEKYYIWSLEKIDWEDDGDEVEIRTFKSETNLITDFIKTLVKMDFDILTGWNTFAFDMPYIINRATQLIDVDLVNKLSPIGKIKAKTFQFRPDGNFYNGYKIEGLSQIDYMLIYKKYTIMTEGKKPSYSLENVCQDELGHGKIEFDGNFRQLYKSNFNLFAKYNKKDVKLIVELERHRQFLQLTRLLCNYSLLEYEGIYHALGTVVNNLVQYSRKVKTHIPYRRTDESVEKGSYQGAFVYPTKMGRYDKGIASFDVQSLYPNTMIALNVSPEKKVGKILDGYGDKKILRLVNGATREITNEQLKKLLVEKDYTLSANNVLFECKTQGILPSFLEEFFKKRVELKRKMKKLESLPEEEKTKEIKQQIERLDTQQVVFKIILNSVYGSTGTPYSPYFDPDIAEAITLSGQKIIKSAISFIEKFFQEKYNHPVNDERVIIAGDTDSNYINLHYLTKYVLGEGQNITHKNLSKVNKEIELVREKLNKWCKEISKKIFFAYKDDRIKFEREIICDIAYFFKKKNYLAHILDKEGIRPSKEKEFKFTGIALVRSTYPAFAKNIIKTVYQRSIIENWNESQFVQYMNEQYDKFRECGPEDIAKHRGINTEDNSEVFLVAEKGTTGDAKAALYYNQLIQKLKLTHKYDLITKGSQIRLIYLNAANEFGLKVMAFPDKWPKEFDEFFCINYKKQFETVVLKPLEHFITCNHWSKWDSQQADFVCDLDSL